MIKDTPSETKGMPKGIPYIIGNEAAERFSFYGMKAALVLFMANYLHLMGDKVGNAMSETRASAWTHIFVTFVYFTPLLGAFISDRYWGKYSTIIRLSIVYCLGHAALALMGIAGPAAMWLVAGLGLIAIGAGGIKPCVSAHVGDQFGVNNQHLLTKVFNWFYFSINLGAAISNIMIPWVLERYGPHWAFGIPGALMAIATLLFYMGRREFIHIPAAGKQYTKELFSSKGIKTLAKISAMFLFVSIFWSLFDQTASTWVLQAQDMDLHFLGLDVLPAQIQSANPFFILLLIPIFTYLIYPLVEKKIKLTPLRKIGAGLFLTVIAFSISAFIQEWIDAGKKPNISWQILAYLLLTSAEIMVSIVCLEFAYKESPKSMKSMVMSLFLLSVAFGNLITAGVNIFIQIDNPLASETSDSQTLLEDKSETLLTSTHHSKWYMQSYAGADSKMGTADDIDIHFNHLGVIKKRDLPAEQSLTQAAEIIQNYALKHDRKLPLTEVGQGLIDELTDKWGQPLTYRVINSSKCRITSTGSDKTELTQWDNSIHITVKKIKKDKQEKDYISWLDKRKKELQVTDQDDHTHYDNLNFKREFTVGGLYKLEGASYFWFFTGLMLITAIIFIPAAMKYKSNEN